MLTCKCVFHIIICFIICMQALRWCDEGAYLLASQMVDRFQTKEGAQEALQYLSCHQERAPSAVKNCQDSLSFDFEAVLTPQLEVCDCRCSCCSAARTVSVHSCFCLQSQITMVTEKLNSVQAMIRNREQCLRKLADVQVRPIQLVAPRPEPDQTVLRCKSPLFSPKHGNPCILSAMGSYIFYTFFTQMLFSLHP